MPRYLILILLAAVLPLAAGCGDAEDVVDEPTDPEPRVCADTPNRLIEMFEAVYCDLDIVNYRDAVLADEYEFILQNETVEEFELPDEVFDRAEELAIAERMFSGQANSDGKILTDIEIQILQPEGLWQPVAPSDPYFGDVPGALVCNYSLLIYFNVQGDFRYEVRGNQLFYVAPDTVMHEGAMTPCYRLRGQLDQTTILPKQASEGSSWGTVKALSR